MSDVYTTERASAARAAGRRVQMPAHLCMADNIAAAAHVTARRVHSIGTARGHGAYVYVSPDLRVYVIGEEQSCAQQWLTRRLAWLVGYYSTSRHRVGVPELDIGRLAEDMAEHVREIADEVCAA